MNHQTRLSSVFNRATFAEHLAKVEADMWAMFNYDEQLAAREARVAAGLEDGDPTPFIDDADDEIEMTPEEMDRYLDDWATNMPADIFEQLVSRRSMRLKVAMEAAQARCEEMGAILNEAYWKLWETLPIGRKAEVDDDGHIMALYAKVEQLAIEADEAEAAYLNR